MYTKLGPGNTTTTNRIAGPYALMARVIDDMPVDASPEKIVEVCGVIC